MAWTETSEKLGPEVEVDEKTVGGVEPGSKGPFVGKTWIVGAVERRGCGPGRARLRVMKDIARDAEMLGGFICDTVRKGSIFATDAYLGYSTLNDLGYFHDPRKKPRGLAPITTS